MEHGNSAETHRVLPDAGQRRPTTEMRLHGKGTGHAGGDETHQSEEEHSDASKCGNV